MLVAAPTFSSHTTWESNLQSTDSVRWVSAFWGKEPKYRSPDRTEASKWHLQYPCEVQKRMGGPRRRHQSDVPSACTIPGRPTDASFSLVKHADQQRAWSLWVSSLHVWRLLLPVLRPIYLAEACRNPPRYLPSGSGCGKKSLLYGWPHAITGFRREGHRNKMLVDWDGQ